MHAAFESPGTDYKEDRISLDNYVSDHPHAVYYVKVEGDCLEYSGIESGDLLVVDKILIPRNGDVIIGVLNDSYILACYIEFEKKRYLMPDNPKYAQHLINEYDRFTIEEVIPHTVLTREDRTMFGLIDCNNFYVSCERAFQPELRNKAGVVLSNNDGCAIARSQEAKDLAVKMSTPYLS